MHAELAVIKAEFESALVRLHALRTDVPASVWSRRPAPEQWSPGECVAHLNLTALTMVPPIRAGLEEARRRGGPASARYRRDWLGWLLWRSLKPAGGFKSKTIPAWVPSGERSPDALIAEFERLQVGQIALVHEADGLPIDRIKITSPVDARVRYNVFSALAILSRHQHRHLWQAEQNGKVKGQRSNGKG